MNKRTPPYGKLFQPVPKSGVRVAIGPGAWDFAKDHYCPIMVLPEDVPAQLFTWPSDKRPALIHERGTYDDESLDLLAGELLRAGSPSVVVIREALLNDFDPRVFYDAEVLDVAA